MSWSWKTAVVIEVVGVAAVDVASVAALAAVVVDGLGQLKWLQTKNQN